MGIYTYGSKVTSIYYLGYPITAVYIRGQKVWPDIIMSCYSNGYWIDEYPWIDDLIWNNQQS